MSHSKQNFLLVTLTLATLAACKEPATTPAEATVGAADTVTSAPSPASSPVATAVEATSTASVETVESITTPAIVSDPRQKMSPQFNANLKSLPACPSASEPLFTVAPTDPKDIWVIAPLGKTNPYGGHVFPTDHHYVLHRRADNMPLSGIQSDVRAPSDMRLLMVVLDQTTAPVARTDYMLYFYACDQVQVMFFHIQNLTPSLKESIGEIAENCQSVTNGVVKSNTCEAYPNIAIKAGDVIGRTNSYDFGMEDYRKPKLPFQHAVRTAYTVSPYDYFTAEIRSMYQPFLGDASKSDQATLLPSDFVARDANTGMGSIMYDVAGTASGNWYKPGQPDFPESPHVSLHGDYIKATTQRHFSIGSSLGTSEIGRYAFAVEFSGTVNLDFDRIVPGPTVYCYDRFITQSGAPTNPAKTRIVLVRMDSANEIQIETRIAESCAKAGPTLELTAQAVRFVR